MTGGGLPLRDKRKAEIESIMCLRLNDSCLSDVSLSIMRHAVCLQISRVSLSMSRVSAMLHEASNPLGVSSYQLLHCLLFWHVVRKQREAMEEVGVGGVCRRGV